MTIYADTREKKNGWLIGELEKMGHTVIRQKLDTGDYANVDSMDDERKVIVDRKYGLIELILNTGYDHDRFIREIKRARENNILLVILVEEENCTCIEDILDWTNPLKYSHDIYTSETTLYKRIKTISNRYSDCVHFEFCTKRDYAKRLVELLEK